MAKPVDHEKALRDALPDDTERLLFLANHLSRYSERQIATPGGQWTLERFVDAWLYSGLEAMRKPA